MHAPETGDYMINTHLNSFISTVIIMQNFTSPTDLPALASNTVQCIHMITNTEYTDMTVRITV